MKKLMIILVSMLLMGCATYLREGRKREDIRITYKELSSYIGVYSSEVKILYDKNIKYKNIEMYKYSLDKTKDKTKISLDKIKILDIKIMLCTHIKTSSKRMRDYRSLYDYSPWQVIVYSNYRTLRREESENIDIIKKFLSCSIVDKPVKCPLVIIEQKVTYNCIGNPEANIFARNASIKTIKAFRVRFYCYNDFNRKVYGYGSDEYFTGVSQRNNIGRHGGTTRYWTLHGFENTTKIKAEIIEIRFTDGSTWKDKK